jgi:hypothetical protein
LTRILPRALMIPPGVPDFVTRDRHTLLPATRLDSPGLFCLSECVVHPRLPVAVVVAQPPGDREGVIGVHLDPSRVVQGVLEACRTFEGEPPVGNFPLVAVAVLGEGAVVAEEDDPDFLASES